MNNKLPAEILAAIMAHLPSSDKCNCLLVCEVWYQHISRNAWFNTLTLEDNNSIVQAGNLFINKPHLGQQVKHLSLLGSTYVVYDGTLQSNILMKLPQLLPRIKTSTLLKKQELTISNPIEHLWNFKAALKNGIK